MDQGRDKLLGQIRVGLSPESEQQIRALAGISGVTAPEYIRQLLDEHLTRKASEYRMLAQVFDMERTGCTKSMQDTPESRDEE